jgi:hypothetical protein
MGARLSPAATRAQDPLLLHGCSLQGLRDRLPLRWPTPEGTPPSPKKRYRSHYTYQGWEDLENAAPLVPERGEGWRDCGDFDLVLRLVDFSGLRDVLAALVGWTSGRGWVPFDPVSIWLLLAWQLANGWSRAQTLRHLREERYRDYARRFGFHDGVHPTEGGLRHFLTALGRNTGDQDGLVAEARGLRVGVEPLNTLLAQSVLLLREAGLITDAAWDRALLCPDGMLHVAASAVRCTAVSAGCYQPTSPATPRLCPARQKGRQGCGCDTAACASHCRHATPRDPEARYVWYQGTNAPQGSPNRPREGATDKAAPGKGRGVYGYRTVPLELVESLRRFGVVLLDAWGAATMREEVAAAALLRQVPTYYPTLGVGDVAGDAAFGYDLVLQVVYEDLQARRLLDQRAHPSDRDTAGWVLRGYDDRGRPICPYGYALRANGHDARKRRHKWVCAQACRREGASPRVAVEGVEYPPTQCPYAGAECAPQGKVLNVGARFGDGSLRLVRDVPVGTPAWRRLYHRARNAAEGRHAALEGWGLKRLPLYGAPRAKALLFQADVWLNLMTLARLVREATVAASAPQAA